MFNLKGVLMFSSLINEYLHLLIRLVVAGFLGGLIGLERDVHGRSAGLRTHLIVCIGASLFMIMSEQIAIHAKNIGIVNSDPARIAAQIVTGIGFLGAGTIIREGFTIRGLTTAACLWVVAAIGMATGAGNYILAISTTILAILSLIILQKLEKTLKKDAYRILTITAKNDIDTSIIIDIIKKLKVNIQFFDIEKCYEKNTTVIKLSLNIRKKGIVDKLSHSLFESLENSNIKLKKVKWDHHN
jgi:putative Mg2+ transporter-C (MgtC) family protein